MTADLERLRGLLEKATPGDWVVADNAANEYWKDFGKIVCAAGPGGIRICDTTELFTGQHEGPGIDAQLIAAMKNALPALLAEVEQLRAERERDRKLLSECREEIESGLESEGEHEPEWSKYGRDLIARIDAAQEAKCPE